MTTNTTDQTAPHSFRAGVWGSLGEPRLGSALEQAGFDWVCLDGQHGHFDDRAVRETLALRREPAATMLVRVLANDGPLIGRALDAGADGVIVPMVQSAEEAELAVRAAPRSAKPSPSPRSSSRPSGRSHQGSAAAPSTALLAPGEVLLATWRGTAFLTFYILNGTVLLLVGIALLRTRALGRSVGWWALAAGVLMLVPSTFGILGLVMSILSLLPWCVMCALVAPRLGALAAVAG